MFFQLPKLLGTRAPPPPSPFYGPGYSWCIKVREQLFSSFWFVWCCNHKLRQQENGTNNNRLLCNEAIHVCKYVWFVKKKQKSEVPPLSQNNKHKLVSHIAISLIKTILMFWTRRFEEAFNLGKVRFFLGGEGWGLSGEGHQWKWAPKGEGHTSCELFKGGSHIFSKIF